MEEVSVVVAAGYLLELLLAKLGFCGFGGKRIAHWKPHLVNVDLLSIVPPYQLSPEMGVIAVTELRIRWLFAV
jgi:hypothetical protein